MSERAWRDEGRMAGDPSRMPVTYFTDAELWAEYERIKRELGPDRLYRKQNAASRVMVASRPAQERGCDQCGAMFRPKTQRHRFCSMECVKAAKLVPVQPREKVCPACGMIFEAASVLRKYCTNACKLAAARHRAAGAA